MVMELWIWQWVLQRVIKGITGQDTSFWDTNRKGAVYIMYMNTDGTIKSTVTIDKDTTNVPSSTQTASLW